jgi:hypothetical protein
MDREGEKGRERERETEREREREAVLGTELRTLHLPGKHSTP